ncbi:hypothetical protein KP509_05G039100 [Ceratopteris richardii]|uniref:Secreted protein n=1 Tax=Ceratopteris richardii TaxID=49495 RepID=A0A8T2UQ12_CERRI|nr:hypothetical protein KP509_05G039100 [Ceratopteris richardii]
MASYLRLFAVLLGWMVLCLMLVAISRGDDSALREQLNELLSRLLSTRELFSPDARLYISSLHSSEALRPWSCCILAKNAVTTLCHAVVGTHSNPAKCAAQRFAHS